MAKKESLNKNLLRAKTAKKDEFYTQLADIERELEHYKKHFKDKIVFCNCDDPRISNFFNYFVTNFKEIGLKKLITACYRKQENNLFNTEENEKGFYFEYTGKEVENNNPNSINIIPFKGDGDFRSAESIELLKQADIVVTNPPFSLFREYVAQLVEYDKKFIIIGNINAITYKEIFKLIKDNKAWLGCNMGRGISGFIVPNHYELYGSEARIDKDGNRIVATNNCLWLTNINHDKRNSELILYKKYYDNKNSKIEFPKYDNYDAINIDKTKDIPLDYEGAMGVPITFLDKFNPNQFEILWTTDRGGDGMLEDIKLKHTRYGTPIVNGKAIYARILIRKVKK